MWVHFYVILFFYEYTTVDGPYVFLMITFFSITLCKNIAYDTHKKQVNVHVKRLISEASNQQAIKFLRSQKLYLDFSTVQGCTSQFLPCSRVTVPM